MKKTITLLLILVTVGIQAQDKYALGMQKALSLWENNKPIEASNMFERISLIEMDNWLPYYYVAQINTIISFGEKDKDKVELQLKKAQEFIAIADRIAPNHPEIIIQQAMINTAYIAFDGATYAMTLSGKNNQLYGKALQLAPDNPRVVLSKAEWDMGTAAYFGKDTTPYCKEVERALELFTNFKAETPFYPSWGKERAEEVLQNCKK